LQEFIAERMSKLRKANYMSRLLRNLFLVCSAMALAGCQHPLAPSVAWQQPAGVNDAFVDARATVRVENVIQPPAPAVTEQVAVLDVNAPVGVKPQAQPLVASVQKQDSQIGQLADGLMQVFATFTGH
jgi:hypothetical protein